MFDLGWTELLLIGIVALIVVGPKDLPGLFRSVGRFVGKAKGMAREFSRAMEDAADEAGVKDISTSLKAAANPKQFGLDKVKEATDSFKNWEPGKETGLDEDRAAMAKKIHDASAKAASDRQAAEAAAADSPEPDAKPVKKAAPKEAKAKAPAKSGAKAPAKKAPKKSAGKAPASEDKA
ncbi:sec-independent protein translocase protein TatB [Thalassovita litoralis]|uniref:Sec-independent protein translocase protein TatB n=1 Tax=Thalassovita litoralis TaxID=1010611 RepID=A0A521B8N1_9RHOB|nr:Sec-independent protein translocase protein TatB [Thalassovita litoralis]SMO43458.1 sec-independent protein translocase protein TatB [Thalassovita litoralis]